MDIDKRFFRQEASIDVRAGNGVEDLGKSDGRTRRSGRGAVE
jgi:hypothetical protein